MTLPESRWHVVAPSEFPWEREALEWMRANLPDEEPWHVWTNFEFIDDHGKVNEVDALVVAPSGLFLVEIKSRPGSVRGDAHTWTWTTEGRPRTVDNPLLLTNRKAKRLASLLRHQPAVVKAKRGLPRVEALVFLSDARIDCRLEGRARSAVYTRGRPGHLQDDGLVSAMLPPLDLSPHQRIDRTFARAIARAINDAGIRPSNRRHRIGDYQLQKLIADGDSYQEWIARHVSVAVERRIRVYNLANTTSPQERENRIRQAAREFTILEGIEHPGILRCHEYKESELGPALIFDHDPKAVRLDHLLHDGGARLNTSQRLHLVRAIAETLAYAHSRRLFHRALSPRCVLVRDLHSPEPRIQLMNWQAAARPAETGSGTRAALRTAGTIHVDAYVEDPDRVYLAPEIAYAEPAQAAQLDVFSLGCLAWLIFSGQPPAENGVEMNQRLRAGPGLRLSDVQNGCSSKLVELIQLSTTPELITRFEQIVDVLDALNDVEEELTRPDPEDTVDPSQANVAGCRIEGGFTLIRRLGRGSSSDALLVRRDGSDDEHVLKVAVDVAHNEDLEAEAEALQRLRHDNIVAFRDKLVIRGRTALLLASAGRQTLAERLREDGRLSLEMLQRFGEELLDAVRHLENSAVVHRDIKPENIGIAVSRNGRLKLCLFDFSLCRTPPENIGAGTPPYLDPFFELRSHRRWDLYAERFAAAVTLYEMAVGKPPRWGDGQSAPQLLQVEATIERELFNPAIRDGLDAFFTKALRRSFNQRHDNAEDMLRAWRNVFEARAAIVPAEPQDDFTARALTFTARSTMAELGYGVEARDVLERMGIADVEGLLRVDRIQFRYLRGVGDRIRREIRLKAKSLAALRPDLARGHEPLLAGDETATTDDTLPATIDDLVDSLLPQRAGALDASEQTAIRHYLGLDAAAGPIWPSIGQTTNATGQDRAAITAALLKARARWLKSIQPLTEVREELVRLLETQGQVMTVPEAAQALLAMRGCALRDEPARLRAAGAVLRAAIEAERQLESPRFDGFEIANQPLVSTSPEWAEYAGRLGAAADRCAGADSLLSPSRALEDLRAVPRPILADASAQPLPDARLLRLATGASSGAALSSSQQVYPRGLAALRALKAAIDALVGPTELSARDIAARVRGRYPEAEPLPDRPGLDQLLQEAEAPLVWEPAAANGRGAYRRLTQPRAYTGGTTTLVFEASDGARRTPEDIDTQRLAREAIDARLALQLDRGGLLLLATEVRLARRVEDELLRRYGPGSGHPAGLQRLSLDALLLDALRREAQALGVDWAKVLSADGSRRDSRDWSYLNQLVQRVLPGLRDTLLGSRVPLLAVHAGLLARYDLLTLIPKLEADVGRPGRTPSLWLLLPTPKAGVAQIDGHTVPVVMPRSVVTLDRSWLSVAATEAAAA